MERPGYEQVQAAAAFVRDRVTLDEGPIVGVVLGSGLGAFADQLEGAVAIGYAEIPHFPQSSVHSCSASKISTNPMLVDPA
jgi:purine nucleoside phosphorylase